VQETVQRFVQTPFGTLCVAAVATTLALVAVVAVAGSSPSGHHEAPLVLTTGPAPGSPIPPSQAPVLPHAGPWSAAIWVRGTRRPAAPVSLLASAGVPATVVHDATAAFAHPLVLTWPRTTFTPRELRLARAYARRGGTLLAVAPDAPTRLALGRVRGGFFDRLEAVPEEGLSNGSIRDVQIAALRRWWEVTPGGFRLGDAPDGRTRAVVLLHDLRTAAAYAYAGALARDEQARGVAGTYVAQTRFIADASGPSLVGPLERDALHEVRAAGGDVAAGGVAAGDPSGLPAGDGREAYPTYSPSWASPTDLVGATTLGELRVSRFLAGELGGSEPTIFRAAGHRTPTGFAGLAQSAGYLADASLPATSAGGSYPFVQSEADGTVRPLLRFPVAFQSRAGVSLASRASGLLEIVARQASTGAPTLLELAPDPGPSTWRAEQTLLDGLSPGLWVGSLGRFAPFWQQRSAIALDPEPVGDRAADGWLVRLHSPGRAHAQSLVAPFAVASAAGPDGRPLRVVAGRRVLLPDFSGSYGVQVFPRPSKG
jgi:hypothetical protein